MVTHAQRRVDTLRRTIHALDAQRVLVFMNYQHRLKVRAALLRRVQGLGLRLPAPVPVSGL